MFFFIYTASTEIYTLSLHDALPISVKIAGVKRLIVVGGAGSLYVDEKTQLIDTDEFPEEFKLGASGARDYLNELKSEKDLDWVFFSPAIEMNPTIKTGRTGKYRLGKDQPAFNENIQYILRS